MTMPAFSAAGAMVFSRSTIAGRSSGYLDQVTTYSQWQKRDLDAHRLHRVDAISQHSRHGRPLGKRLGVKTRHRQRTNLQAILAGRVEKLLADLWIGQGILERFALAERAHIDLNAVGADLIRQRKRAEFLPLENHPIADADLVSLPSSRLLVDLFLGVRLAARY